MKRVELFDQTKLSRDAKRLFSQYVHEFDLYKEFLPESSYSGLRDDILGHIIQKIEDSPSKNLNKAEANEILESLGSVKSLVSEFKVPPLIRLPFLGSMVGMKQISYNFGLLVILGLVCYAGYVRAPYMWAAITNTEGSITSLPNQSEEQNQWTVTKADKTQDIEVIFPTQFMHTVYVYHGQNLKDNEVFLQFKGTPGYKIKTSYAKSSSAYGKMIIELYTDANPEPIYPTDEYDPDNEYWATGYQELMIFVPEQLNFKGGFNKYPLGQINTSGPKITLVEVYLQKGIVPSIAVKRNEYDANTTFGYFEAVKNATSIGVELNYLGKYKPQDAGR